MHLDGGPVGRLAQPYIEIFGFARFEKEHIVAIVEVGQLIQLVELGLGVELCIFAAVRYEGVEIVHEMSVSAN